MFKSKRYLRWFSINSDKMAGEVELKHSNLKKLRDAFNPSKKDDYMFSCYKIDTKQKEELVQNFTEEVINFDTKKYEYFIELEVE
jgi:hypothetical protein